MADIWFISDTHFSHKRILEFLDPAGDPIRGARFSSVEEMNEVMIENWNASVKITDKVYHLGDVAFGNEANFHTVMERLNGHKRLILGNHDKFPMKAYTTHFEKVMESRPFGNVVFTHRPIYIGNEGTRLVANVHGHVHESSIPSMVHKNISVEVTDYKPVHIDEIFANLRERGLAISP